MANANIKAPTGGIEKTVDEFGLGLLTVARGWNCNSCHS